MSLFPAYNSLKKTNDEKDQSLENQWLQNSSYKKGDNSCKKQDSKSHRKRSRSRHRNDGSRKRRSKSTSLSPRRKGRSRSRSKSRSPSYRRRYRSRSRSKSKSPRRKHRSRSKSPYRKKNHKKSSRHHKKKHKNNRHRSSSNNSSNSNVEEYQPNREELIAKHSYKLTFLEDVGISPENAYREDRVGDKSLLNVNFLPLNVTSSYKNYWQRQLLTNFKHPYKNVIFSNNQKNKYNRYHDKDFQKQFRRKSTNDLSDCLKPTWTAPTSTFLRFINSAPSKQDEHESEEEGDVKLHEIQQKTKDFNEKLRRNPYDVDLWMEYVDFQDYALAETDFTITPDNPDGDQNEKSKKKSKTGNVLIRSKAIVEKKLSILKNALDHNPKSMILYVKNLDLSKEILDSDSLNRKWEELLELFPGEINVWDKYLYFLTSHFTSFKLSKITSAFKDCLYKLKNMTGQAFRQDQTELENQITNVIVRMAHLWSRSGYRERSMALFQALVEFNLFSPKFPGYFGVDNKLKSFKSFWDSGVPRFGENGALGWCQYATADNEDNMNSFDEKSNQEDEEEEEQNLIEKYGDKIDQGQLWLSLELMRESKHYLPVRNISKNSEDSDEEEEEEDEAPDDLDRQVQFQHVQGFLYAFQDPRQMFKLLLNWLHFLGLDTLYHEGHHQLGLLGTQTFHSWLNIIHPEVINIDDYDVLLKTTPDPDEVLRPFILSIFNQAFVVFSEPFRTQIVLLWLRYEAQTKKATAKEIKVRTMRILEKDQTNTRIYIGYALALSELEGSYSKSAKKVLDMALESSSRSQSSQKSSFSSLVLNEVYVAKAGLELKYGQSDNALWTFSLMASNRPFEPCQLNKLELLAFANKALNELENMTFDQASGDINIFPKDCEDYQSVPFMTNNIFMTRIFGLCWLYYLLHGVVGLQNISNKLLAIPSCHSIFREVIYQVKTDILIHFDSEKNTQKSAKESILHWTQEFPSSPNALRALRPGNLRIQTAISSRFWRHLSANLTSSPSFPQGYLTVIKLLIQQFKVCQIVEGEDRTSITSSGDNLGQLFKAWRLCNEFVMKEPCRTCPQVWRLLMWTTKKLSLKNPFRYQPKTIFYRALQDNPSAKALGLDLIYYCASDHESSGASVGAAAGNALAVQSDVQDIFTEKEVRIRMPIEELKLLLEDEELEEAGSSALVEEEDYYAPAETESNINMD